MRSTFGPQVELCGYTGAKGWYKNGMMGVGEREACHRWGGMAYERDGDEHIYHNSGQVDVCTWSSDMQQSAEKDAADQSAGWCRIKAIWKQGATCPFKVDQSCDLFKEQNASECILH